MYHIFRLHFTNWLIDGTFLVTDQSRTQCLRKLVHTMSWHLGSFQLKICFISASFPRKTAQAVLVCSPVIVKELETSASGVVIFSAEQGANVSIVSLILWIEADKLYHSDLCTLRGPTTHYHCRKCIQDNQKGKFCKI